MKTIIHFLISMVLSIMPLTIYGQAPVITENLFYYTPDMKVYIEEVPDRFMIKKEPNISKSELESIIYSLLEKAECVWFNSDICTIITNENEVVNALETLILNDVIVSARRIYITRNDKLRKIKDPLYLGITDQIVLKFKDNVDKSLQNKIIESYDLNLLKQNEIYGLYSISKNTDLLTVSNLLYETGLFEYAHPEFICKVSFFDNDAYYPNDPYFQYQVTLHNTGQIFNGHSGTADADIDAPEAWNLIMGNESVVIAVIDKGVTSDHPDLPDTRQVRLNDSNFGDGDPDDPSPTGNNNHGNACAGVIAATINNNEGIAGIAPLCKIMPIRIVDNNSMTEVADAIRFAVDNGAKVISNSWGYNTTDNISSNIVNAISYATSHGSVVLFAAGNTAKHVGGDNGYVCFPANQTISGKLSVGASDRYDQQSDYSPSSTYIDIVAPSHRAYPYDGNNYAGILGENLDMWSLDIPGNNGYNPWASDLDPYFTTGETLPNSGTNYLSYTGHFGGTSHACPVVAGVTGLILSLSQNLTPQMVCSILKASADKVGGYTYVDGRCDQMGYGRVNAKNAVWLACDTTHFINTAVTGLTQITGCDIYMKDDCVINNGFLKVRARNSVIIDGQFYVFPGSKLDIKRYTDF